MIIKVNRDFIDSHTLKTNVLDLNSKSSLWIDSKLYFKSSLHFYCTLCEQYGVASFGEVDDPKIIQLFNF